MANNNYLSYSKVFFLLYSKVLKSTLVGIKAKTTDTFNLEFDDIPNF